MIRNVTRDTVLAKEETWALTVQQRTRGLLDSEGLAPGQALGISPCNSVHMVGMAFALDVLFVNKDRVVIRAISNLKPWRLTRIYFTARHTLELPVGTIRSTGTRPGDQLSWDPPGP